MRKYKVLTGISRYSDPDVVVKAKKVNSCMEKNVNYPSPTPTLSELTGHIDVFETSLTDAANGSVLSTAIKNQKRELLDVCLTNLAYFVQANGKNDHAILLSSGFDLQKSRTPVGILPKPENLKVLPADSNGSLKVGVNSIAGAESYLIEYTEAPVTDKSVWLVFISTKANNTISNLISGKQYAFKVAGVGSDTTQVFSDIVLSFVL